MTKHNFSNLTDTESDELQCRQNINTVFKILLVENKISSETFNFMTELLSSIGNNFLNILIEKSEKTPDLVYEFTKDGTNKFITITTQQWPLPPKTTT